MKKNLSLLLAAMMVLNTLSVTAFAFESPLKKYNLYDDVMGVPQQADDGTGRERGMGDYYNESLGKKLHGGSGQPAATNPDGTPAEVDSATAQIQDLKNFHPEPIYQSGTRNQTLRESSRNVYSDPTETPSWMEGPVFYAEPTLESIILKYRKSDFAGCMQECEAYVRKHPADTLGYYYLAMCYTKCSEKDKAIRAYEQVIALNDNPMIVKYATNGRNCVMENETEACFEKVNEPELIYPYAHLADVDLQPIDPQVLINRNLSQLRLRLSPLEEAGKNNDNKQNKETLRLPFGDQNDSSLDAFINAPYGNGLSPKVNQEYQQLQLKKIQQTINNGNPQEQTEEREKIDDIKNFDKFKTDSETIKLAYDPTAVSMEEISKDPEYIKQQQELNELNMLLGNEKKNNDFTDLLPYMTEGDKKVSPEVIRDMMMQSMMESISI